MTDHYDLQVAALHLAHEAHEAEDKSSAIGALREYGQAAGMDDDDVHDLIVDYAEDSDDCSPIVAAWSHGFTTTKSLFSTVPGLDEGIGRCLTMIKVLPDHIWHDRLGLTNNELIPGDVDRIDVDNLPEFARLRRLIDSWPSEEAADGQA